MTVAVSLTKVHKYGRLRTVYGTFTSDAGDSSVSVPKTMHGLNVIIDAEVTLKKSSIEAPHAKVTIDSTPDITASFRDTMGQSGDWRITGHK